MNICDYSESEKTRLRKRLTTFFSKYDPEKLSISSSGENIFTKTLLLPISEAICFQKMCSKYEVDAKQEEEDAKFMKCFPLNNEEITTTTNDDDAVVDEKSFLSSQENSIQKYSASEKQRLAKRIEKFFSELVLGETNPAEVRQKVEKLLLGDVSESDLMKRLCDLHRVDSAIEQQEAKSCSLLPQESLTGATATTKKLTNETKTVNEQCENDEEEEEQQEEDVDLACGAVVNLYPPAAKKRLLQRLIEFYEKFDPTPAALHPETGKAVRALEMNNATENQIFAKLCEQYKVGIFDEQDQARFHGLLPVCSYDKEEQDRLRKRLQSFYTKHVVNAEATETKDLGGAVAANNNSSIDSKIDKILQMPETEEQIFETLCVKYLNGQVRLEQAEALRAGVYPLDDEQDQIKKNAGKLSAKDYPWLEKQFRLRKRLENFHKNFGLLVNKNGQEEEKANLEKVLDELTESDETEEGIFQALFERFQVDPKIEKKSAERIFAFPKF